MISTLAKFALDGENVWKYFKLSDCRPPFALHAWKRTEGREFMEWLKTNPEKSVLKKLTGSAGN